MCPSKKDFQLTYRNSYAKSRDNVRPTRQFSLAGRGLFSVRQAFRQCLKMMARGTFTERIPKSWVLRQFLPACQIIEARGQAG